MQREAGRIEGDMCEEGGSQRWLSGLINTEGCRCQTVALIRVELEVEGCLIPLEFC